MLSLRIETLELILKYSPIINIQDNNGQTVLHHFVRKTDKELLKRIIKIQDIDFTIQDNNDLTAYKYALGQEYNDAIKIFELVELTKK